MNTQPKGSTLLLKLIGVLWVLWVLLDYWFKHPLYAQSFSNVKFAIPLVHLIVGGAFYLLAKPRVNKGFSFTWIIGLFLAFLWAGTLTDLVMNVSGVDYTAMSILFYVGRTFLYVCILLLLTVSAHVLGRHVCEYVAPSSGLTPTVYIAVGLSIFMVLTFVLLFFGIFQPLAIGAIFVAPLLAYYQSTWNMLRSMKDPLKVGENDHGWILIAILALVLMNAVTFSYTLSPYPVGFDAQKHYINLPKLIAEDSALQKGYQPHNWSLLQAAAYNLTGRIEFLLILSWYGLLMVQWALWDFGRRCLKMPVLAVLLAIVLFTFMPAVTQQASQELKIDLALTFYLLAMMICLFRLLDTMKRDGNRIKMVSLAFLIGWIGGIALGIKLTAVIAIFGVLAIIWYQALGKMAFLGFFLVFLGVAFFAQLDVRAGLRAYHESVGWLQVLSVFSGLCLLFFAFKAQVKKGLKLLYLTTVIGMSSVLIFSPWLIKNYAEIKQPTMMKLLNGTSHGPDINMRIIHKNLKQQEQHDSE